MWKGEIEVKNRLVLKASAGTGKTYRLSLEYVGALCRGTDFKDILVMTFTKKATAEIKERILKFLKELSENAKDGESIKENLKKRAQELSLGKQRYLLYIRI